jgi:hypothetical protein
MAQQYLPEVDHVVRYVPWARLRKDEDDNVLGVLGIAFKLRETEDYLSATWLEFFGGRPGCVETAIKAIRSSAIDVKTKSGFAIGKVEQIKSACEANERRHKIRVIHEEEDDNKAHAALRAWPRDNDTLLDLIADDVWNELVLNKDIAV